MAYNKPNCFAGQENEKPQHWNILFGLNVSIL